MLTKPYSVLLLLIGQFFWTLAENNFTPQIPLLKKTCNKENLHYLKRQSRTITRLYHMMNARGINDWQMVFCLEDISKLVNAYDNLYGAARKYCQNGMAKTNQHLIKTFSENQFATQVWEEMFLDASELFNKTIDHVKWFQKAHRCLMVTKNTREAFHTEFCTVEVEESRKPSDPKKKLGFCIPAQCGVFNGDKMAQITTSAVLDQLYLKQVSQPSCHASGHEPFGARNFLCFIFHLILLVVPFIATNNRFLSKLSAKQHWQVISELDGRMPIISLIRTFSLLWVIWGHVYMIMPAFATNIEASRAYMVGRAVPSKFSVIAVIITAFAHNFTFSVDAFLFISGYLNAKSFLYSYQHGYTLSLQNLTQFYKRRIRRIAPAYYFTLFFCSFYCTQCFIYPIWWYINPLWQCQPFWQALLFMNNLGKPSCLPWTWSLAVDMQLYLLSPFILFMMKRHLPTGRAFVCFLISASIVLRIFIAHRLNIGPTESFFLTYPEDWNTPYSNNLTDQFVNLYINPLTRAGPFLLGLLFACDSQTRQLSMQIFFRPLISVALWAWLIFGSMPALISQQRLLISDKMYVGFSRTAMAFLVGYVITQCENESTYFLFNRFARHRVFTIIANLSYCAYLIHVPVILALFLYTPTWAIPFDAVGHLSYAVLFCIAVLLTMLASFVLYCWSDGPARLYFNGETNHTSGKTNKI